MPVSAPDITRRSVLMVAAGIAAGSSPLAGESSVAAEGRPGDFDFLTGEWRIHHRRLKPETGEWDDFEGEATVFGVLQGIGSIEELRIPVRNFSGIGIRLLDVEQKIWSDFWVSGKSGVLTTPGLTGIFRDGAGIFEADDRDGETPIRVRGVWDRITPRSCRWYQAVSRDNGASWQENWFMDWSKV